MLSSTGQQARDALHRGRAPTLEADLSEELSLDSAAVTARSPHPVTVLNASETRAPSVLTAALQGATSTSTGAEMGTRGQTLPKVTQL